MFLPKVAAVPFWERLRVKGLEFGVQTVIWMGPHLGRPICIKGVCILGEIEKASP